MSFVPLARHEGEQFFSRTASSQQSIVKWQQEDDDGSQKYH